MSCEIVTFKDIVLYLLGEYIGYKNDLIDKSFEINSIMPELGKIFNVRIEKIDAFWVPCRHQSFACPTKNLVFVFGENYPEEDKIDALLNILSHEISHIFIHKLAFDGRRIPVWANEGFAQYYGYKISGYKEPSLEKYGPKIKEQLESQEIEFFNDDFWSKLIKANKWTEMTVLFIELYELLIREFGEDKTWEFLRKSIEIGTQEASQTVLGISLNSLNKLLNEKKLTDG